MNGIIYITWLRQSYYVFTAQLKFNAHIYNISEDRYNVVKLSPHMFTAYFKYVSWFNLIMLRIQLKRIFNE